MDEEWAQGVLRNWLYLVNRASPETYSTVHGVMILTSKPEASMLAAAEDQTRRVVSQVIGGRPVLLGRGTGSYEIVEGEKLVRFALGRLGTDAETRAHLGSTAPTMAADALHPLIWNAASSLWDSEHYGPAVQRGATMLSAHVQDKVNRHDVSDSALMTEVFSERDPQVGKARLRWPGDDDDQTVKSMRSGLRQLAPGAFLTIRNPAAHTTDEMGRQEALECLATLSQLARWVDACEVVTAS